MGSENRAHESVDNMESSSKCQRFERDTGNSVKKWEFLSGLAAYLNKYSINHISKIFLRQKILNENVVLSSIENVQIHDEYIKDLCSKTKRTNL